MSDDPKRPITNFDRIEKIELADRPRRPQEPSGPPMPEMYRPLPPQRSTRVWPWVVILLLLGAVAALRLQRVRDLLPALDALTPSRTPTAMVVMSNPSGATLKIDGVVVGKTPWAGDNHWRAGGSIPYELSADGYVPLKGFFEGDKELNLELELRHR